MLTLLGKSNFRRSILLNYMKIGDICRKFQNSSTSNYVAYINLCDTIPEDYCGKGKKICIKNKQEGIKLISGNELKAGMFKLYLLLQFYAYLLIDSFAFLNYSKRPHLSRYLLMMKSCCCKMFNRSRKLKSRKDFFHECVLFPKLDNEQICSDFWVIWLT